MLRIIAALVLALGGAASASAQSYPDRPVNVIVAAPAGGSTDVGARVVGSIAEKALGQPLVIINKAGAGGQVGWTELARARPDGYTIGFIVMPGTNTVILDPDRQALIKEDSYTFVINHVHDAGALWVRADSPYKSFADLIAAAKAAPGTIRAATTGILSDDHLNILMTEEATGAKFRIIHLEGNSAQLKETLGGNVDVAFDNVSGVVKPLRSGQVRVLAVTDKERSKFLPDVPNTTELGFPSIVSSSTRGIVAPKGTPEAVVKRLADELGKAMQDPDHTRRMDEQGLAVKPMAGAEFKTFWTELHEKSRKFVEISKQRQQ